jgi:undecaprenyl-phosphate galactose phosphotransferase
MDQELIVRNSPGGSLDDAKSGVLAVDWSESDRLSSLSALQGSEYPTYSIVHRLMDVGFALALIIVFLPLAAFTVIALSFSDGSILFKQKRLGLNGREFNVYKFRTMVPNADEVLRMILENDPDRRREWEQEAKLKSDPRVTPIGRFLRKTSLDELPQLFNILAGEMSLVGPRPIEPNEISKYGRYARHYFAQRPGLTGLWQVSGRNDCSYQRRIALDAFYARNRSLPLDISIIIKTIRVVLTGRGAY